MLGFFSYYQINEIKDKNLYPLKLCRELLYRELNFPDNISIKIVTCQGNVIFFNFFYSIPILLVILN